MNFLQKLGEYGLCIEISIYLFKLFLLKKVIPILEALQLEYAVHKLINRIYLHNQELLIKDLVILRIEKA